MPRSWKNALNERRESKDPPPPTLPLRVATSSPRRSPDHDRARCARFSATEKGEEGQMCVCRKSSPPPLERLIIVRFAISGISHPPRVSSRVFCCDNRREVFTIVELSLSLFLDDREARSREITSYFWQNVTMKMEDWSKENATRFFFRRLRKCSTAIFSPSILSDIYLSKREESLFLAVLTGRCLIFVFVKK